MTKALPRMRHLGIVFASVFMAVLIAGQLRKSRGDTSCLFSGCNVDKHHRSGAYGHDTPADGPHAPFGFLDRELFLRGPYTRDRPCFH
jgi:hypothetical protein